MRLNASIWPVRLAARSAAFMICSRVFSERIVSGKAVLQHFRVALYDHQEIVEVVSNAARKPTHGFHLLSLAKLLLKRVPLLLFPLALGDVTEKHNRSVTSFEEERHGAIFRVEPSSVQTEVFVPPE